MAEKEELMTTKELARYLSMTEKAIRNRVWKGTLPVIRIGKSIRFSKAEIDKVIRREAAWGLKENV